ncbi:unnamed protein product [Paramecium octaurelia]|uniref:Uncharacterized protein n=1 Tax=Paramecium octaurelia TaxID=43137 RepID=A0A8S1WDN5_PAROT|nr:unnamed protein product [Paramecium octaurelia]
MNDLKSKQIQETQEAQKTICKFHNLEFIAVDLDTSEGSQIKFLCGKCLVDKLNNYKVSTIEQSKESIQQQSQRKLNKTQLLQKYS